MSHWLFKSEPDVWGWDHQVAKGDQGEEVCRESQPDSTTEDPRWDCVMIRAVRPLKRPVTLEECKVQPGLEGMVLINNSRLSVQPVSAAEWGIICRMGGVEA